MAGPSPLRSLAHECGVLQRVNRRSPLRAPWAQSPNVLAAKPRLDVRDFYGHASLSTTNRYLHAKLDATAVAAMNAAHGIES